jgi:HSP20 family protein
MPVLVNRRGFPKSLEEPVKEQGTQLQPAKNKIGPFKLTSFGEIVDDMRETFDSIARRAYEIFESNGHESGLDLDNWFRAERELLHPLNLEVREAHGSIRVQAEVPGFEAKDLEISLEPSQLIIAGKRDSKTNEEKRKILYSECRSDRVFRRIDLPCEVNAEKATGTLKDGILELDLPKTTVPKKVKIEPKTI